MYTHHTGYVCLGELCTALKAKTMFHNIPMTVLSITVMTPKFHMLLKQMPLKFLLLLTSLLLQCCFRHVCMAFCDRGLRYCLFYNFPRVFMSWIHLAFIVI